MQNFFTAIIFLVGFVTNIYPSTFKKVADSNIPVAHYDLLKNHGNFTLAYSKFQPGLNFFTTSNGVMAYEEHFGRILVLGDPLSANAKDILGEFIEEFKCPFFCGVSERTAAILSNKGFYVNSFGKDPSLCIQNYSLEGSQKQKLRQAWNKFQQLQSKIEIVEGSFDPSLYTDVAKDITKSWVQNKVNSDGEVRFLTRPISYDFEEDVRKFFVKNEHGNFVALYYFDPIYENGEVIGYSTSFKRRKPEAMTGLEEAIVIWAINKFREEGKRVLNLGLIPLYKIEEPIPYQSSFFLERDLLGIREKGDRSVYNFKGLADFKHRFRGEEQTIYLASKQKDTTKDTLALFFALKNFPKVKASSESKDIEEGEGVNLSNCKSAFKS